LAVSMNTVLSSAVNSIALLPTQHRYMRILPPPGVFGFYRFP
jgi:hypothetical protein